MRLVPYHTGGSPGRAWATARRDSIGRGQPHFGYSAEEYIRESIVEPDAYTAGTADGLSQDYQQGLMSATMAGITLTDEDVDALVEYLLQLR